ncbi:MAG: hypothetical protein R3Y60_01290 [bacterium]
MRNDFRIKRLVLNSIFLALVIALHTMSIIFKVGIFELQLSLVPIVIGAILLGPKTGATLGLASALFIMLSGGANLFLAWNPFATWLIVLTKGILSGLIPGLIKILLVKFEKINIFIASFSAPVVNTSIFALGCIIFFLSDIGGLNTLLTVYIGANFFIEVLIITILSPAIYRICIMGFKNLNIE